MPAPTLLPESSCWPEDPLTRAQSGKAPAHRDLPLKASNPTNGFPDRGQAEDDIGRSTRQNTDSTTTGSSSTYGDSSTMESVATIADARRPEGNSYKKTGIGGLGSLARLTKVDTAESGHEGEWIDGTADGQHQQLQADDRNTTKSPEDDKSRPTTNGSMARPVSSIAYRGPSIDEVAHSLSGSSLHRPPISSSVSLNSALPMAAVHSSTLQQIATAHPHRYSSPPVPSLQALASASNASVTSSSLRARHSLLPPRLTTPRISREYDGASSMHSEEVGPVATGRFSPTMPTKRRMSLGLGRITSRVGGADGSADEILQDEDAARYAENVLQKRAYRRKVKGEEDDERVVVGTKVDQNHVNWVTAYNMLTGIRFCVSRTNAKLDRALTDNDFLAKHKFSFDVTGNELTPSARYDFKFKDYAPWVFRHLRTSFGLDPAEYLMSLTSKYILSELGSPGKSGSFFYFSRDYKYIIKTIHHAEHQALRRILKEYYTHVQNNPNTLISQFYGLHRVKIPFGRKIHFVIMNNLFPPHRDIHQTFDLKGSTIGRDFKEENLEQNPRATLKDLNWLRRDMHLEFGPIKKAVFLEQVERDVELLKRMKIMDYSLLIGVHDLQKGNEEELRNKTLRIFEPGGEKSEDMQTSALMRTPSKLENARKARELRKLINAEKPMPIGMTASKMPEEILDKTDHAFYNDDGGFRATHEDDSPDTEIYYLGIIDCLTHYGIVKRLENFWKGLWHSRSQISPVKPVAYGDRFRGFIRGITMSEEAAALHEKSQQQDAEKARAKHMHSSEHGTHDAPSNLPAAEDNALPGHGSPQSNTKTRSTDKIMAKAERQAEKTEKRGASEDRTYERTLASVRSPSAERTNGSAGQTLPVVEEVGENGGSDVSLIVPKGSEETEKYPVRGRQPAAGEGHTHALSS